jgi:hypothetical protein
MTLEQWDGSNSENYLHDLSNTFLITGLLSSNTTGV